MDPDNSRKISHHVSNIIITPVYTHVASLSSHSLRHADLLLKQDPGLRMSSKIAMALQSISISALL